MNRTCQHPGCEETYFVPCRPGQPPLYCQAHRSTKYAMIRKRKHPELKELRLAALPPCCRENGKKCAQHLQTSGPRYMRPSKTEQAVIAELIDVWGHASIWNDRGWNLIRVLPSGEDEYGKFTNW